MSRKTVALRKKFAQIAHRPDAADLLLPLRDVKGSGRMTQIVNRTVESDDEGVKLVMHRRPGVGGSICSRRIGPEKEQRWRNILRTK